MSNDKNFDVIIIGGSYSGLAAAMALGRALRSVLIIATGIVDILPGIEGLSESWGISVLHCPYCHGYEVRDQVTGILANGEEAFQLAALIANWTEKLTIYTNGISTLTPGQNQLLQKHQTAAGIAASKKLITENF